MQQLSASPPSPSSPWAGAGLQLGASMEEAVALLGETKVRKVPIDDDHYYDSLVWSAGYSAAFLNRKAEIISSKSLEFNGAVVLKEGDSCKNIIRLMGQPDDSASETFIYRRHIEIRFFLDNERIRSIQLSRARQKPDELAYAIPVVSGSVSVAINLGEIAA